MPQINEEFLNKLKKKKPELRPYDLSPNTNESKAVIANSNISKLPVGDQSRGKTPLDDLTLDISPLAKSPRVNLSTDNSPLVNTPLTSTPPDHHLLQTQVHKEPSRGKTPLAVSTPDKSSLVKPPLEKTHVVDPSTDNSPLVDSTPAITPLGNSTRVNSTPATSSRVISPPVESSLDKSYLVKTPLDHSVMAKTSSYDSNFKMFSFLIDKLSQLNASEIRMLQIIKKRVINSNEREVFISRVEFEKEGLQSKFITTIIKKLTEEGLLSVKEAKNKTNKTVKSYSILEFWK